MAKLLHYPVKRNNSNRFLYKSSPEHIPFIASEGSEKSMDHLRQSRRKGRTGRNPDPSAQHYYIVIVLLPGEKHIMLLPFRKQCPGRWFFCVLIFPLLVAACHSGDHQEKDHPAYHHLLVQPFTDSIGKQPREAKWFYLRAEALAEVKEDALAISDLRMAYQLDSLNPQYTQALGYLYLQSGQPEEAIKAFQKLRKQVPADTRVALLLGRAYLQHNELQAATQELTKVLQHKPNDPEALYWKAKVMAATRDTAGAISLLQQVLHHDPDFYMASYQLADWYNDQGNAAAPTQYRYTFQLDTLDVGPLYDIGRYYERQQRWAEAKGAYRDCILRNPDYTPAYLQTGRILYYQDSVEKALRQFNLAVKTQPNDADAFLNKGLCFEKLGQPDSARNAFRQALVFRPGWGEAEEGLKRNH